MSLQGYSTHGIARALEVAWKTAARLSAPLAAAPSKPKRDVSVLRAQWQSVADDNPTRNKKMLRVLAPALYACLYRNDREWLLSWRTSVSNIPISKRRVDWGSRDAVVAELIQKQVQVTLSRRPQRRASRHHVLGELGIRTLLEMREELLPRSTQALSELCESVEEFQVRRLARVMAENEETKDWCIRREAGVNSARFPDGAMSLLLRAGERVTEASRGA